MEALKSLMALKRRKELKDIKCKWRTIYQSRCVVHDRSGAIIGRGYHYYDFAGGELSYHFMNDLKGNELPPGEYNIQIISDAVPVISPFEEQ